MIRKLQNVDINKVVDLWLKTNLEAHNFISEQYWTGNYEAVKKMLPQAEVYVYEENNIIHGFVGVQDEYIEGIFVSGKMQSQGIGKALLDYIKDKKRQITVKRISEKCQGNVFLPKRRIYDPVGKDG